MYEIKLASEDPEKKEKRIRIEEELANKALKRKEAMALYRAAKSARYFAMVQSRREAKKKAAQLKEKAAQPKKKAAQPKKRAAQPKKRAAQPKKKAEQPKKRAAQPQKTF